MRYDRARVSLDRHATYIVSAYIAGATRWGSPSAPDKSVPGPAGHNTGPGQPADLGIFARDTPPMLPGT